jgi:hypothetical protein
VRCTLVVFLPSIHDIQHELYQIFYIYLQNLQVVSGIIPYCLFLNYEGKRFDPFIFIFYKNSLNRKMWAIHKTGASMGIFVKIYTMIQQF